VIGSRLAPPTIAAAARAARRAAFGLTPRTFALLAAGLIWIGPAWIDRRALAILALWDAAVALLVWMNLRRLPRPSDLTVSRTWTAPLTIGAAAVVRIEVRNRGRVAIDLGVSDYGAPQVLRELSEARMSPIPPGESVSADYVVTPRERGDVTMGGAALRWRDAWGLVERWGVAPIEQTVRVYPDLEEGRRHALYLIRSRQVALEKRRTKRIGTGREFDSLRDYRPGDERRDVAWTASARRGKLVTKVYQPERSQTVWLLVDAGRLLRARVGRHMLLDATVTAALTLAQVALASGDRVGLLAYGRRLQHRVAPARGAGHLRGLVEALALVHADGVEADHAGAAAAILAAQKRRAMVVWLTEVADTAGVPDVIEHALRMAPVHVVLFAVLRHPDLVSLAGATPASAADMFRVMSAQETLDRRESLLHGLRQRGAMVLEGSPSELSAGLIDRYLEVKERGLL
jgi:uncharacterized protein (DUF58 family)